MKKIIIVPVLFFFITTLLLAESAFMLKNGNFFAEIPPRASVFEKYSGLKQRLYCPKVRDKLTFHYKLRTFFDKGYHDKNEVYCEKKILAGYRVYYAGTWYVWENRNVKEQKLEILATMGGSYSELVQQVNCSARIRTIGRFMELGYYKETDRGVCTARPQKAGYKVYVDGKVFIYNKRNITDEFIPKDVTFNGRYSNLINAFRCDRQGYFKYDRKYLKDSLAVKQWDKEYDRRLLYPNLCGVAREEGHLVYKYPFWYLFKDKRNSEEESGTDLPPSGTDWPPGK